MKKDKIFRLIFYLSLIPYIILLSIALYYAIAGYDIYTWILPTYVKTIYGIDAFLESLVWNGLKLIYIPVLPICLVIQVVYLIKLVIRKYKEK